MMQEVITKLVEKADLSYQEAYKAMEEIIHGEATLSQISSFLTALRMKGETVEEIAAFAEAMRKCCYKVNPKVNRRLVDTCGTGGDRIKTFNISSAAAFVVAGAGVSVAKHGNRSFTSKSGSADVLERLGLNLNVPKERIEKAIEEIGIGFLFAPALHPSMKNVASVRREIGIRTVFNILGPLTNPAMPSAQVIGVYEAGLVAKIAEVASKLGLQEAMVVHGLDGLDEISTIGRTLIAWLREGEIRKFEVTPTDLGVERSTVESIIGKSPEENAEITFKIIYGCLKAGDPKRDIVAVNAAAGVIVGGVADDFKYALELAQKSIESGASYRKLKELVKFYDGSCVEKLEELERRYG
jgi:anthranilate phosphoribosyltransferase